LTENQIIILIVTGVVILVAGLFYWRWWASRASEDDDEPSSGSVGAGEGTPLVEDTESSPERKGWKSDSMASILAAGLILNLHTTKGPKEVKMTLHANELRWESLNLMTRKRYKLDLADVLFVEWGKQTHNFRKATATDADDKKCLSLVSQSTTLDLECPDQNHRDLLAQGFTQIIDTIKANKAAPSTSGSSGLSGSSS
jgi:hypothetical protein